MFSSSVILKEHADNTGAVIGSNDTNVLAAKGAVGIGAGLKLFVFSILAVNFGLPRFLCFISMQVSHFPKAVHLLQGRDTFYAISSHYPLINQTKKKLTIAG